MSGFRYQFFKGSLTKVHNPKLYNMAHLFALNVLLLPKDLTISKDRKKNIICTMDDIRGDFLGPSHGTAPTAVIANKI